LHQHQSELQAREGNTTSTATTTKATASNSNTTTSTSNSNNNNNNTSTTSASATTTSDHSAISELHDKIRSLQHQVKSSDGEITLLRYTIGKMKRMEGVELSGGIGSDGAAITDIIDVDANATQMNTMATKESPKPIRSLGTNLSHTLLDASIIVDNALDAAMVDADVDIDTNPPTGTVIQYDISDWIAFHMKHQLLMKIISSGSRSSGSADLTPAVGADIIYTNANTTVTVSPCF